MTPMLQQESLVKSAAVGRTNPLGATIVPGGVNFSVFSRNATGIELLFFDRVDDARPSRVVRVDPLTSRTYHYWHVFVPGIQAGQIYGFRAHGPFEPASGLRFDSSRVLMDPYARATAVPKGLFPSSSLCEGRKHCDGDEECGYRASHV